MLLPPKLSRVQLFMLLTLICQMVLFSHQYTAATSITNKVFFIENDIASKHVLLDALESNGDQSETVFHLFSHGRSGELRINGKWLNAAEIADFMLNELKFQRSSFDKLHIYGCEFAKGYNGKQAVAYLEKTLSITVAASTNITGSSGDWVLEIGNTAFLGARNYPFNLQCANQGTADNQDYDCDGVINSEDLDDDNDGILDTDEGAEPLYLVNHDFGTIPTNRANRNANYRDLETQPEAPYRFVTSNGGEAQYAVSNKYGASRWHSLGFWGAGDNTGQGGGADNAYLLINGGRTVGTFFRKNFMVNANKDYTFGFYHKTAVPPRYSNVPGYNIVAYVVAVDENDQVLRDGNNNPIILSTRTTGTQTRSYNWTLEEGSFNTGAYTRVSFYIQNLSLSVGGNDFSIDSIYFNANESEIDTDQDGIPDHFDLDSDGDGCPDAIEGGGSFDSGDLVNSSLSGGNRGASYTGTSSSQVTTNLGNVVGNTGTRIGIPTVAGTGQGVGSSNRGATITISDAPEDVSQCISGNVTVSFSATATANPRSASIGYQWQVSTNNGASFSPTIPGASGATSGTTTSGTAVTLNLTGADASYSGNVYKIIFTTPDNACPEEATATLALKNNPVANAGADQTIDCRTTSVELGVATPTPGYSYEWSAASGTFNSTVSNPTVSPTTTETYTVTVTDTTTGCVATDEVTVTVSNTPPTANAGADQTIDCRTTSVELGVVNSTSGYSYEWSSASGSFNSTVSNPTVSPMSTETYTLTVTDTATGCVSTDEVTVTVANSLPDAEAGDDQIIDCITTFVSIGDATADPAYSYSWMPTDGLSDPTSPNPRAEPMTTQTYVLTVTNDATGCTSTDEVTVTVNNELPIAEAGDDQRIDCEITSVILGVEPTLGYRYEWIPATGLSDASLSNPEATPREDTTYTVTVTNEETGCFSTDEVVVTVRGDLPLADAGADQIIDCITTSVTLGTAAEDGYAYLWEPATALTNVAMAQPIANPSETTTYTLTVTNTDTGCASSDTVVVRVNTVPPVADAGADQIIDCNTISVTLGTAAIEGYAYSWRPAAGLSDASVANPIATPTVTTTYTVTVTDTATGCTMEDEVVVTENKTGEIQRENLSICIVDEPVDLNRFFDTPTFSGVAFPETEITWVLEESGTEISTMFNPNDYELGTYTATSTLEQGGCTLERKLTIRVHKECIYTPCISSADAITASSLVTPNGDIQNDTFKVDFPINEDSTDDCNIRVHLQIYNRWGALVYENLNYQNDWTGEAAKDALGSKEKSPRATYYYIIELENSGMPPIQGYFLLGLSQ